MMFITLMDVFILGAGLSNFSLRRFENMENIVFFVKVSRYLSLELSRVR